MDPRLRVATPPDVPAIKRLMRDSTRELFPRFYDERQTASALVHVAHLDIALVEDGTYYVAQDGGEIVACGGWSRRNRLYAGSGDAEDDDRLLDPATEPARVRAMFVRADHTRRDSAGRSSTPARPPRAPRDSGRSPSWPPSPASSSTAPAGSRRSSGRWSSRPTGSSSRVWRWTRPIA